MMMSLKNKVCLVVGASSGMGRQTALYAGSQGATVIAAARRGEECKQVAKAITDGGGKAIGLIIDGTNESSVNKGLELIEKRYERLDCVFNNLGSMQGQSPFHETPLERWQAALDVNLTSVFMLMKAQIPLMLKSGEGGVIINNSSTAGVQGVATMADYVAAKWGLIGLTRTVALEYGPDNIRCLAIAPGIIMTEKAQGLADQMPELFDTLADGIPMKKTGEMQDIAELVCFLMSDKAKYMTGITVPIDGGRTA